MAFLISFVICWFVVLAYRYIGGTVLSIRLLAASPVARDDARHLEKFRSDCEAAIAECSLLDHNTSRRMTVSSGNRTGIQHLAA